MYYNLTPHNFLINNFYSIPHTCNSVIKIVSVGGLPLGRFLLLFINHLYATIATFVALVHLHTNGLSILTSVNVDYQCLSNGECYDKFLNNCKISFNYITSQTFDTTCIESKTIVVITKTMTIVKVNFW